MSQWKGKVNLSAQKTPALAVAQTGNGGIFFDRKRRRVELRAGMPRACQEKVPAKGASAY